MGGRIVHLLSKAGIKQTLWARRREALDVYATLPGVHVASSVGEVGAAASVIGICVWAEQDVEDVVTQIAPQMAPGSVILVHSTVSSVFCQGLATSLATSNIMMMDAPVSTRLDAEKLLVLAGGTAEAYAVCRPVLEAIGDPVVHLGALGAGQLAKLVNNNLMAAQIALANDALRLAETLELDPDALGGALLFGSSTTISGMRMHRMLTDLPPGTDHAARDWAWKDVHSMEAELERCGADTDSLLLTAARAGATYVDR
jgi:3-hydroxyisobutyrate dehydrogenase